MFEETSQLSDRGNIIQIASEVGCMSDCCLCSILTSGSRSELWDEPIFESRNFVVIPSLGSLVEGWVLLVPKQHFISMGALSTSLGAELCQLKIQVVKLLSRKYGEMCAFEHGPSAANHEIGCGVDHAHLHILPLSFDLVQAAQVFMPSESRWTNATLETCQDAFKSGKDYLYIEQPVGTGRIATHSQFGGQIFRKAIAAQLGVPGKFNWRDYPYTENVNRTVQTLSDSVDLGV
ncbi:MAG: hypothetical protein QOG55_1592 [Acidobacteriaceae bacterium]|jgi:ATP adenylyltransferase|nr:hypothetical protein [Acidobacteriaceae bacterium]